MRAIMSDSMLAGLLILAAALWAAPGRADGQDVGGKRIELYPSHLHKDSFDARKVLLSETRDRLMLDGRVFKFGKERQGWVVTDPIDLGEDDTAASDRWGAYKIGRSCVLPSIQVSVSADVPEGAAVVVEARSGANSLDLSGWSPWTKLDGLSGKLDKPAGRYVQIRITLSAKDEKNLPAVKGLAAWAVSQSAKPWAGKLTVDEAKIQKIVRSPIEFAYERPDQPKLAAFRKAARLDEVVAGAKDDFEKLVKLMDWTGSCTNARGTGRERQGGFYQWDIDKVAEVKGDGKVVVHGHCMTYAEVLVTAATAMGYVGSRHMVMEGFREATHEVCDIWVPSLGKWVYFDPSLTNYYFNKQSKVPMSLIEMHQLVADKFVKDGEDMHWFSQRDSAETKQRVREVGGKAHIGSRLGPSSYGEPMPADYDWGYRHGYLAAGFVQMTPRNDFHSNPQATPRNFGHSPGYANYPFWVDSKTPPTRGGANWFTRTRDFYWTLDQASLKLVEGDEGTLLVELGQSMPFFKAYQLKVDGEAVKEVANPFVWKLKVGANKLEVAPVDEFGKVGLASSVTVTYAK